MRTKYEPIKRLNNYPDPIVESQFVDKKKTVGEVLSEGHYHVADDGTVTVWTNVADGLKPHKVSYEYEDTLSGLEKEQLFSVDYENGIIYFNSQTIDGTVTYNLTSYSAFYNIGEVVPPGNIQEINEEEQYIDLHPMYGSTLGGKDSLGTPLEVGKARVRYEYYKRSTESLKDLEPYFSPVCKDIAVRVITKEMMGEL